MVISWTDRGSRHCLPETRTLIFSRSSLTYVLWHPKKSMQASSRVGRWGHRQALRDKDSSRMEKSYETWDESGPRSVNSELLTQPARELRAGLCGTTEWGPGLHGWGMSGQDPEGYVQGCQLSIQGRGPQVGKSLPRWQILMELGTL